MKALLKELSFHIGGYRLHKLFWENMAPAGSGGGGSPEGELLKAINDEYGKFDRFKKEFTQAVCGCRRFRVGCAHVLHEYRTSHDPPA